MINSESNSIGLEVNSFTYIRIMASNPSVVEIFGFS